MRPIGMSMGNVVEGKLFSLVTGLAAGAALSLGDIPPKDLSVAIRAVASKSAWVGASETLLGAKVSSLSQEQSCL
ncbi:hypothetical protein Pmar_PMAR001212 [Perkinsus marinus ATCC 50983]|uniref:Uncharacterized protein n=1 Tax=Perkinsus marinus (strain ATCC 50983 / TXsc) TaxID=423536 RepID=C5KT64_PERM5|nr:hypothetical protein Pmar_PMAR001212 [Perkinsus marinus ATCC 50983]EER12414.1 hypothetical protein Pmar_PMAR001212 [Perkinsus marinus ATCC 50983]|eukprot:XP_002780619.1 hypothetical protein Pmar_PMAR001212 [Perkinsus marinus ATCC 50983]